MREFNVSQREQLLAIARASVADRWHEGVNDLPFEGNNRLAASFVTLTLNNQLRGCIGSLIAHRSLLEDIQKNAWSAAFHDPRFPPLTKDELEQVCFEISVLSEPKPLHFLDEEDLFSRLKAGVDGVILESGPHKATFLPQVWQQLPTAELFIRQLMQKAGLSESSKINNLAIQTYQVESFKEP